MTTFDENGASIDSYAQTRAKISEALKGVFGSDLSSDNEDSVIGKITTIAATVADNANQKLQHAVAVRDPDAASGTGLRKLVKLNGITANEGLYSSVPLTVTANADGCKILAGDCVFDPNVPDILWSLDSAVTLAPYASQVVSAKCTTFGAIAALPGTLTGIKNPRKGWSTVTNATEATLGMTSDTDSALRRRRERAAKSFGKTTISGVWKALEDIDSVSEVYVHENLEVTTDDWGVPGRNMCAWIRGGSDQMIAEVLFKTTPIQTYGGSSAQYVFRGIPYTMYFNRPTDIGITVLVYVSEVNPHRPTTYPNRGDAMIKDAIMAFSAENQKMGVNAIPQQFAAAANVVPGFYVDAVWLSQTEADPGMALIVASREDITIVRGSPE